MSPPRCWPLRRFERLCSVRPPNDGLPSEFCVWTGDKDFAWRVVTDAPEDAPLREAWERLRYSPEHYDDAHPKGTNTVMVKHVPDGLYLARGPGIVACEECCEPGHPGDPGFVLPSIPCPSCNPTGLESPTLVPLAEVEQIPETRRTLSPPMSAATEPGRRAIFRHRPDLQAIIVVQSEECDGCGGAICEECRGTGRIETLEVLSRDHNPPHETCSHWLLEADDE